MASDCVFVPYQSINQIEVRNLFISSLLKGWYEPTKGGVPFHSFNLRYTFDPKLKFENLWQLEVIRYRIRFLWFEHRGTKYNVLPTSDFELFSSFSLVLKVYRTLNKENEGSLIGLRGDFGRSNA